MTRDTLWKHIYIIITSLFVITFHGNLYAVKTSQHNTLTLKQHHTIDKILRKETKVKHLKKIIAIINQLDLVYTNLYEKILSGKKIIVFVDPAHGKLANGKWQGDVTWRQSCKGYPEEYYSIPISRKLYALLSKNPFIEVQSTADFLEVMQNKSDTYRNIPFSRTISMATQNKAFIIISEHLNNVSPIQKAEGKINMNGIHITYNKFGTRYLTNVKGVSKGFLTLYNKLDTTGLSYTCAETLKQRLLAHNFTPNNWEHGTVADDRFTYFINFPISIIYESGFISNVYEERLFREDEEYQNTIAEAQYYSLLDSIKKTFKVDISSEKVQKTGPQPKKLITILKLSRIIIYYIKQLEIQKAINCCISLQEFKHTRYISYIQPYLEIKEKLMQLRSHLRRAKRYKSRRQHTKACRTYRKSLKIIGYNPLFYHVRRDLYRKHNHSAAYSRKYKKFKFARRGSSTIGSPPVFKPLPFKIEKHSLSKPFILAIENGQSLDNAVMKSLAPKARIQQKILKAFRNPVITKIKWRKRYSKKRQRYVWSKRKTRKHIKFKAGIYIVTLNSKYKLTKVTRVSKVIFNPKQYQNQQYFKNSCLAPKIKKRSL